MPWQGRCVEFLIPGSAQSLWIAIVNIHNVFQPCSWAFQLPRNRGIALVELMKELVWMHAGGLEAFNSSTRPLLLLLFPWEVRELTYAEDILIAACSHEKIVSDNPPVKIFSDWGKKATTKTVNDSTEIITLFKTHYRRRVSDPQRYLVLQEV